jgi:hypothetical protein
MRGAGSREALALYAVIIFGAVVWKSLLTKSDICLGFLLINAGGIRRV